MSFEKVPSRRRIRSMAEQIYADLRTRIVRGAIPPDTRLVELHIAAEMGTSQGPVREALHMLERDGLVEQRAGRAMYVTRVSLDELYDLFKVRSAIESVAARRTAARITPEQGELLAGLVNEMCAAGTANDMETLVRADMEFHRLICAWSGSVTLLGAWLPLYAQTQRFILQTHEHYFTDLVSLAETHVPVLEALRSRDPQAAVQQIEEHIMLIWSRIDLNDARLRAHWEAPDETADT
jgi:DNA-binding GntR family transcriptional regulator